MSFFDQVDPNVFIASATVVLATLIYGMQFFNPHVYSLMLISNWL